MKKLKICLIMISSILLLTSGCGKEEVAKVAGNQQVSSESSVANNGDLTKTEEGTAEDLIAQDQNIQEQIDQLEYGEYLKDTGVPVYSYKDIIPIIVEGKTLAFAKINQFERVGIYDWYNTKAVEKNIKHSYSLNMSIKNKANSVLTVTVSPTLITKGNKDVSSYCKVGWTGFNESAEFYDAGEIPIEVGFQPEIRDEDGLRLKLVFETSEGTSEPVIISNNIFKSVVVGPDLKENGEETKITSINGAKYAFTISKVYKEENLIEVDEKMAIEFDNKIKYLRKPQKGKQVATFDSKKKNAMYASLVIGMQTQHNSALTYKHDAFACRKDYYGDYTDWYASEPNKTLKVGKSIRYHLNRVLKSGDEKDKFVRFVVEFPDEAEVANLQEMLKFNGRFTVYQCETKQRKIKYEG